MGCVQGKTVVCVGAAGVLCRLFGRCYSCFCPFCTAPGSALLGTRTLSGSLAHMADRGEVGVKGGERMGHWASMSL